MISLYSEWYKTLDDFKTAKAGERKRRGDVRAEIRATYDKKLNAINRYVIEIWV